MYMYVIHKVYGTIHRANLKSEPLLTPNKVHKPWIITANPWIARVNQTSELNQEMEVRVMPIEKVLTLINNTNKGHIRHLNGFGQKGFHFLCLEPSWQLAPDLLCGKESFSSGIEYLLMHHHLFNVHMKTSNAALAEHLDGLRIGSTKL